MSLSTLRATIQCASGSKRDNRVNSVKHFNIFLRLIGLAEVSELCKTATNPNGILCPNGDLCYENADLTKVTVRLMDAFAGYLAGEAVYLNDRATPLMMNTGDNYFSQLKGKMSEDLTEKGEYNHALNDSLQMARVRKSMIDLFKQRAESQNKAVVNSHKTANEGDIYCTVLMCVLCQDYIMAMFALFLLTLVQFAGRGTEVAKASYSNLTMISPPEFGCSREKIAELRLWRGKTLLNQDLSIFGHKDKPLLDWYFILGFSMVMNTSGPVSENLFPDFFQKAVDDQKRKDQKKRGQSKVSEHFKTLFEKVTRIYSQFVERLDARDAEAEEAGLGPYDSLELNPELSSHSPKRFAVELSDMNPLIKISWSCFRFGWVMRSVHTMFEYLTGNNKVNDRQTARNLSGWDITDHLARIGGGRPPMLSSLQGYNGQAGVLEQLESMKGHLFYRYAAIDGANSSDLQNTILATILKDLHGLISLLLTHPLGDFGHTQDDVWSSHLFLQKIERAAQQSGIPEPRTTLLEWSDMIHKDWVERNYMYIPYDQLARHHADNSEMSVDPRCIMSVIQQTQQLVSSAKLTQEAQGRQISQLTDAVAIQNRKIGELSQQLQNFTSLCTGFVTSVIPLVTNGGTVPPQVMAMLQQAAGVGRLPQTSASVASQPRGASARASQQEFNLFPTTLKSIKAVDVFKNWFTEHWFEIQHHTNIKKDVRSTVRLTVEYLSLFLDAPVPPLPQGFPCARSPENQPWRRNLDDIATRAWAHFEQFYKERIDDSKKPSQFASAFKKKMAQVPAAVLPTGGHPIDDSFQPPDAGSKLRTREKIVAAKQQREVRERSQEQQQQE